MDNFIRIRNVIQRKVEDCTIPAHGLDDLRSTNSLHSMQC